MCSGFDEAINLWCHFLSMLLKYSSRGDGALWKEIVATPSPPAAKLVGKRIADGVFQEERVLNVCLLHCLAWNMALPIS